MKALPAGQRGPPPAPVPNSQFLSTTLLDIHHELHDTPHFPNTMRDFDVDCGGVSSDLQREPTSPGALHPA
jgi:hypothetical protein